jgi:hypothetical protein
MQELRLRLGMGRANDDDLLFPRWDTGKVRSPHWLTQKFALLMETLNNTDARAAEITEGMFTGLRTD